MDTEERPSKIRKLSHDDGTSTENVADNPSPSRTALETMTVLANDENNVQSTTTSTLEAPSNPESDEDNPANAGGTSMPPQPNPPLSKSAQKKLRKRQEWESQRDSRRLKRKEKTKERKARQRTQREQEREANNDNDDNPHTAITTTRTHKHHKPIRLPITFLIDCGFDDKMTEKERISLGSQVTRAYADNSRGVYQAHLVVSSWGGELKQRFETVLGAQHRNWKGVVFTEEDFVGAAEKAREGMCGPAGGRMKGVFGKYATRMGVEGDEEAVASAAPVPPAEVVYLTSDSPNTLTELVPNSTYIIGGIVDKNRHKGLCYRIACDRGVKTAKLPIGEFMEMQSRFVLATNHVVEIMIRWLECGDWGESFMKVIPKRKGGRLRGQEEKNENDNGNEDGSAVVDDHEDDEDEVNELDALKGQAEQEDVKVEREAVSTSDADLMI